MTDKEIVNCIPHGHENAVTRSELIVRTGEKDRAIRNAIASSDELVINLQDGKGYFKPTPEEGQLVDIFMRLHKSRIKEEFKRIRQARDWNKGRAV